MRIFISVLRTDFTKILGGESFLFGLLKGLELDKSGHDVFVAGGASLAGWIRRNTPSLVSIEATIPGTVFQRVRSEAKLAPRFAAEVRADVSYFPFNLAPAMPVKKVVFIHDLASMYYRKNHPFQRLVKAPLKTWLLRATCRRADAVLSGTRETCRQIIDTGWIPESKVYCVNDAVSAARSVGEKPESVDLIPDDFLVLLTGANYIHKDRMTALRAFRHLVGMNLDNTRGFKMVIVGSDDDRDIRRELQASGLEERVQDLGYVDSNELEWLMCRANVMLLPTRHEGFGLGILEAQMRGVPLVASDIPVVREVSGGVALFFSQGDFQAAAHHIDHLSRDETFAKELAAEGKMNAAKYSIERMARETIQVLESVVYGHQEIARTGSL